MPKKANGQRGNTLVYFTVFLEKMIMMSNTQEFKTKP